jgi:integrase
VAELRTRTGVAVRALEFTILTASRTREAIEAVWSEIDYAAKTWTVPAGRMKGGREHRVPLSDRALNILAKLPREDGNPHVFIGSSACSGLHNLAMSRLLRDIRSDITVHGFRSTFRDWAAERTNTPNFVVEQALAHAIGDKVEAAYRRGDLFEKRRKLMDAWAAFCNRMPASGETVVQMRGRQ